MKMRIISGEFKRRLINVPNSKLIRPMTDRVRETLFNLLNNKIDFEGIKALDLYSGSGSLGFECISRGASEVHFVEKNFLIYQNLIKNIDLLSIKEKSVVHKMEVLKFSDSVVDINFDLILADPPFFKDDIYEVTKNIITNKLLKKEGFMIIERSIQTKEKDIRNFSVKPLNVIGDACLYEIRN
jgi:16S rRNA (guanine966-N2)-methyltransferase